MPTGRIETHASLLQALRLFCLSRSVQQEEGYQSHTHGQSNADGEGDLWRDPGTNEGLSQRAEHDGKRDG